MNPASTCAEILTHFMNSYFNYEFQFTKNTILSTEGRLPLTFSFFW